MTNQSDFRPNTVYRICSLGKNPLVSNRLAQMGILPGMEVKVVRLGPLGDPLEITMDSDQNIALRTEEAAALDYEIVALPLANIQPGPTSYRIRELIGGPRYQQKLEERGLRPGTRVTVETVQPYRLNILPNGPTIVVGYGEAEKLLLEAVENL